jgi:F0F1-type ATP synthase membrane subunit c/vacuolar-type H+-ATPase subunit K
MENGHFLTEGMRFLATALAVLPLVGVGIAVGKIFVELVATIGRNPSSRDKVFSIGMIGFAVTEAIALFCVLVALLILYR